jgi:hypothetical protein
MRIALLLFVALIAGCSDDSEPDGAGGSAGQSAGASGSGGSGGAAGTTAAAGGVSGTTSTAGTGGVSGGGGGSHAGTGGTGASSGAGGSAGSQEQDASIDDSGIPCSNEACPPDPIADQTCVVAQRIDNCCTPWVAVSHGEAKADPCLIALGEPWPSSDELLDCQPQVCTDVLCLDPNVPPSRTLFRADGACMFGDECQSPADCVLANDVTRCCNCTEAMPKSLVDQEPCLVPQGQSSASAECNDNGAQCLAVLCAACAEPTEPTCTLGDALRKCM